MSIVTYRKYRLKARGVGRGEIDQKLTDIGAFLLKKSLIQTGKEKSYVMWLRRYFASESAFAGRNCDKLKADSGLPLG